MKIIIITILKTKIIIITVLKTEEQWLDCMHTYCAHLKQLAYRLIIT